MREGYTRSVRRRPLPDLADAQAILARKRTRPIPRPPPSAGRQLAPVLKALGSRFDAGPQVLTTRWSEIVGETLARRSEAVKLVKRGAGPGTLEIRVDGPAAALLQHQGPDLLARVNLVLGADSVGRLRIVQGPLRKCAPAAPRAPRLYAAPPPLDAAADAELAASLAGLGEGRLKRALLALGRAALREPRR